MFLPTKAHQKEITPGQYKIRKGNRVPKGAVNLAYMHLRNVSPKENIRITDLSNTILENQQNKDFVDKLMYPSSSMLLENDNYENPIPSDDILVTNVFSGNTPLYFTYRLEHRIYDKKGPDIYGIYNKTGMSIVDKNGNDVERPYRFEIREDPQNNKLYFVDVFTSFNDVESEEYEVMYNAVMVEPDGQITTIPSHRERMILGRTFRRTHDIAEIAAGDYKERKFYKANSERPYHSKVYVGTPEAEDLRPYDKFRYQFGVEIETAKDRSVYTSPWYSEFVIHKDFLSKQERDEYVNGYKKITDRTLADLMGEFASLNLLEGEPTSVKYFVNIDNPNVIDSVRIDGSSEVYVRSVSRDEAVPIPVMPEVMRITKRPVEKSSNVNFNIRPLKAGENEIAYISFVMDNSESMSFNDSDKVIRYKILESAIYSANDYYHKNKMNICYFANFGYKIRDEFLTGDTDIVDAYRANIPLDNDVTRPAEGLEYAAKLIDPVPAVETIDGKPVDVRKYIIMATDGEYDHTGFADLEQKMIDLKAMNIRLCIITFHNLVEITGLCEKYGFICIDGTKQGLAMQLRYIFFTFGGLYDGKPLYPSKPFSMSPIDNDNYLMLINDELFKDHYPAYALAEPERYAVEIFLDKVPYEPELTLYIQENVLKRTIATYNGDYILKMSELQRGITYDLYAVSNAYRYFISHVYSVRNNDRTKIKLLMPRTTSQKESWYARIQNGRFDREIKNKANKPIEIFSIPEYYRQDFVNGETPVARKVAERAEFVNDTTIRLTHLPFIIDQKRPATEMNVMVNGSRMGITAWNSFNGLVELNGVISESDDIKVSYTYDENSYVYKGYYDAEQDRFWHLDLNPTKGHYVTYLDPVDEVVKDVPTFYLIDKVVYFYLRASAFSELDVSGNIKPVTKTNRYTLMHTFEKIERSDLLLIGEIRIRPNSNHQNIKLYDSRIRGGGLDESITLNKAKQVEVESAFYWDIGYWDGQPFPENGIVVVRITRNALKEYGGRFTKLEIEEKVNKHLAYGVLPIVEYLDDPDILIARPDGLTVEIHEIPELGDVQILKPTFDLEVKNG